MARPRAKHIITSNDDQLYRQSYFNEWLIDRLEGRRILELHKMLVAE